jgi:hypothetical protein
VEDRARKDPIDCARWDIGGTGKVVGDQAPQWAFPAASPPFQSQVHGVNGLRAGQRRTTDDGFCARRLLAEGKWEIGKVGFGGRTMDT